MTFMDKLKRLREVSGTNYWAGRLSAELCYMACLSSTKDHIYDARLEEGADCLLEALNRNHTIGKADGEAVEAMLADLSPAAKALKVYCVSHAHIDMNWMWGFQETAAVTVDTFRTVLNLMKDYPDFTFAQSQASTYRIIEDFAELMNRVVSPFPLGEPPFTLAFENLWWEGLKLRGPGEWKVLERKLEFDNWGFTLDTGHMMNTIDSAFDEDSAVDGLLRIIGQYPKDMIDRIGTVHLQCSASAQYRTTFEEASFDPGCDMKAWCEAAYHHAGRIDQHRPFTSKRALEIVDILRPDYLTHELYGSASGDRWKDVTGQRSLFKL